MRSTCFFLFILCWVIPLNGQIYCNFETTLDSGWLQDPPGHWALDTNNALEGTKSLHQTFDNTLAGNDRISYPLTNLVVDSAELRVRFRVRHGYNPSSSNKWGIYVYADADATGMKPGDPVNGYVVGVNFTGSDDLLKLWKVQNGSASVLLTTSLNWQEKIGISKAPIIEVRRTTEGSWTIFADTTGDGFTLSDLGTKDDASLKEARYFGISYTYSATKDLLLWFDDLAVDGAFVRDTVSPSLLMTEVISENTIRLKFSENVNFDSARFKISNYELFPDSASFSGNSCILHFNEVFPTDEVLELKVTGIRDLSGNLSEELTGSFLYHSLQHGDVVINEMMADPTPTVGLPEAEYLELFNTTAYPFNLKGWVLEVGTSRWILPELVMTPGGFAILTSPGATGLFGTGFPVVGVLNGNGSLANAGSLVVLRGPKGELISAVHYMDTWYKDEMKKSGGWSLERRNPYKVCSDEEDWEASVSLTGGTPGNENSRFNTSEEPKYVFPKLLNPLGDSIIILEFSETPDSASACNPSNYEINNGIGQPVLVRPAEPESRIYYLDLKEKLKMDMTYEFTVQLNIIGCNGLVPTGTQVIPFAMAREADSLEVLFSEFLYDVPDGSSEFIEIFNASGHAVDLSRIRLSVVKDGSQEALPGVQVSTAPRLLYQGEYAALSAQPDKLYDQYTIQNPNSLLTVEGMPVLSNEGGCAVLMNSGGTILDKACWSDEMHHPLLVNTQGVSLERTNFDGASLEAGNWHSASSLAGYATPGYENSQETQTAVQDERIKITPEIITPDNDGKDDYAQICIDMGEPGWVAQIHVYDMAGRMVKEILNNALTGTVNRINWDGTDNRGAICYNGIYIFSIRLYNLSGATFLAKKVCVVTLR